MSDDQDVLFSVNGSIGTITLNRPKALNALTLGMVRLIMPQLTAWETDPAIKAIVIEGVGEKAFCAGGDVVAVYKDGIAKKSGEGDGTLIRDFFKEEYKLNYLTHSLSTPYIALLDGITMGGGVGLSVHGPYRVATERFLFAMPETGIGLYPDVGGTYLLSRMPGAVGCYLGLTGARLKAGDGRYAGIATHYVPSDRLGAVKDALVAANWDAGPATLIAGSVLDDLSEPIEPETLATWRPSIDRYYRANSMSNVLQALSEGSEWAKKQLTHLRRLSPTSVAVTFEALARASTLSFADCFVNEYRLTQRFMAGADFYEGIRALLIDKDKKPAWNPKMIEQVSADTVASYFEPLGQDDLVFET